MQVVIVTVVIIVVLFGLGFFVQRLMNSNREPTADKVHKVEKQVHEAIGTLLKSGREQFNNSRVGQKMDLKSVAIIALWDLAIKNLNLLDPGLMAKKDLEKLIQETLVVIANARDNAVQLGSLDAQAYIEECTEELRGIAAGLNHVESLMETKRNILRIKSDAEKIAQAQSFGEDTKDAGKSFTGQKQQNYYDILKVSRNATQDEIRKSYLELAKLYHPDKYAHLADDLRAEAERRFMQMNEAYAELSNPEKKKKYDQTL